MRYDNTSETRHAIGEAWLARILGCGALLAITFIADNSNADGDVYKIQGKDGRVEYTDQQPKVLTGVKRLPSVPDSAGVVLVPPKVLEETETRIKSHLAEQNRQYDAVAAAEEKLRAAQKAKVDGEEPLPGERQRLRGGGSRLNDNYEQRQAILDDDIKAAQAEVGAARGR